MDVTMLIVAFAFGFAASLLRLPPLVGYLIAGFTLHALGFEATSAVETIADLGVILLLFGIGLKLKFKTLARPEVWGAATSFAAIATAVAALGLWISGLLGLSLTKGLDLPATLIIALALSFSSTVFAVKALERTNETDSLAGRIAVGVLIIQDLLAVTFLVISGAQRPSWWALALLPLLLAFRPVAFWLIDRSGHGELLTLLGFTLAAGVGAETFYLAGLKPDLGALVIGIALASHPRAGEMSDRLLGFKDLFLIGFFLSIGLSGTPPIAGWIVGIAAAVLIPTRSFTLLWIFTRLRLRSRTALHTSLTLSTYSEFGLIVVAAAVAAGQVEQHWLATVGIAVAGSFVLASVNNSARYRVYDRLGTFLSRLERQPTIQDDAIIEFGEARVLVFGMGRIGLGAYDELVKNRLGPVVGIDRDPEVGLKHQLAGRTVIRGDALDRDFWERVQFHPDVELVIAATSNHAANLECVRRIREFLPNAQIAAAATYPDQVAELHDSGVDIARNLYEEAGQALADDAAAVLWAGEPEG
ncbi:MAG: cation:proton antiporter [Acidimicrobiia bacterium]|nr:cation:proton antiporter [Acidimicrobiia bacterium]